MTITTRILCAATLLAVAPLAAHADDYYLNCVQPQSWFSCSNFDSTYKEFLKFTPTGVENEYQLALEHICSDFYITGTQGDKAIHFGTTETAKLTGDNGWNQHTLNKDLFTYDLVNSDTSLSITNDYWTNDQYYYFHHLILTLTIDSEDKDKATLKVEHITNDKLKKGVPSFLYVVTDGDGASNTKLLNSARLVKGDGMNYTGESATLKGNLSIRDGLTHYGWLDCFKLSHCSSGGGVTIKDETVDGITTPMLIDYYNGNDFINGKYETTEHFDYAGNDGFYTIEKAMYQGAGGATRFETQVYNVTYNFLYDISQASTIEGDDYVHDNHTPYEDGEEYDTSKYGQYTGTLTIKFNLTEAKNFCVTLASDGYAANKAITMSRQSDLQEDKSGNIYEVYTATVSTSTTGAFNTAFYVKGYNGTTLANSTSIMQYSPDDTTDSDCVVKKWEYMLGSAKTTSNVVEFKAENKYNIPYTNLAIEDEKQNKIPYYAISSSPITITFRYNLNNPSKSLMSIETSGTLTGVDDVVVSDANAPVEYYNLNGVRVDGTAPGLYIRRQGSTVTKVVVR